MKKLLTLTLVSLFILGCATPYEKTGLLGGFSDTQLDSNVFSISFQGNGYTSREKTKDFTMLRSAELALQNGYQYFAIIEGGSHETQGTYTMPTQTHGSATTYGNTTNFSAFTTGGQTLNFAFPSESNTIVCYKEKPDLFFTYNTNFIYKSITQKYKIKESLK